MGVPADPLHGHVQAQVARRQKHQDRQAGRDSRRQAHQAEDGRDGTDLLPRGDGGTDVHTVGDAVVLQETAVHPWMGGNDHATQGMAVDLLFIIFWKKEM